MRQAARRAVVGEDAVGEERPPTEGRGVLRVLGASPRVVLKVKTMEENGPSLRVEQRHRETHQEEKDDDEEDTDEFPSIVEVLQVKMGGDE